jgi:tetratricopeptide (TPR) repeat protein
MESELLAITGIPEAEWPALRRRLEAAALVEAESLPGVAPPFLRFHPTLAPLLWAELDADQRERLGAAYRARYHGLANYLYREDPHNPEAVSAIARRELPNLLHAVEAALKLGEADAVEFADRVNRFLNYFGLRREAERLTDLAQAVAQDTGSKDRFLVQFNRGRQLLNSGRIAEAAQVFQTLLQHLGETASYLRAVTLAMLGRCFEADGQPNLAAEYQRQALAVLEALEPSEYVQRLRGACLTDRADALVAMGRYPEARRAYEAGEAGLVIAEEQNDLRGQGVTLGQLGWLALREGNTAEAAERYQATLALFQQLQEPASEAVVWHQLGTVYQNTRQWDEAERCYRESARLKETLGDLSGAAQTWNNLAIVNASAGKPEAAERWYRKAIEGGKDDPLLRSRALGNLADLLQNQPHRLAEARSLAEEALSIHRTLDPGAAEIWKTYHILAQIAEREAAAFADAAAQDERRQAAREYRRLALDARRAFPGSRVMLKQRAPLILTAVAVCAGQGEARTVLAEWQAAMRQGGPDWTALADALDRLLAGERDAATLCEGMDYDGGLILETILRGIAEPDSVAWLKAEPKEPD